MPRQLRREFPGAVYHVVSRGDRREPIFRDDGDRRRFLTALGEACATTDWQVHVAVETRRAKTPEEWERIRRDWYFGGEQFRNHLRDEADGHLGLNHLASERDESGDRKAERIVAEELARLGWGPTELGLRRKGDPDKVRIARRLRAETTRTLAWIAWRLEMGSWTKVSNLLRVAGPETRAPGVERVSKVRPDPGAVRALEELSLGPKPRAATP